MKEDKGIRFSHGYVGLGLGSELVLDSGWTWVRLGFGLGSELGLVASGQVWRMRKIGLPG